MTESRADRVSLGARLVMLVIRAYQIVLSPIFGGRCRFEPSCSRYGMEAVAVHGALRGSWMAAKRIGRCHPWNPGGYDPVPPRAQGSLP